MVATNLPTSGRLPSRTTKFRVGCAMAPAMQLFRSVRWLGMGAHHSSLPKARDRLVCSPSHGENRGSSPLGGANEIKYLFQNDRLVSNDCPINIHGQAWMACRFF